MPLRSRTALLGACACVALLALDWVAASQVSVFRHADQSIFLQFGALHGHGRIAWVAGHLVARFDPDSYVVLVLVVLAVALLRGRPRVMVAVVAIVLGANMTTELLKQVIAPPHAASLSMGADSSLPIGAWPSGHATAAMALVLAAVPAVPARLRPAAAALGGALAVAVGYSVMTDGMHYPSEVVGGFLVAAAWALCAVAALVAAERWRPSPRTSSGRVSIPAALGPTGAVLVVAVALAVIVLVVRPHDVVAYADAHRAFVIGTGAIAALGLALSTGVLLSVRR